MKKETGIAGRKRKKTQILLAQSEGKEHMRKGGRQRKGDEIKERIKAMREKSVLWEGKERRKEGGW